MNEQELQTLTNAISQTLRQHLTGGSDVAKLMREAYKEGFSDGWQSAGDAYEEAVSLVTKDDPDESHITAYINRKLKTF